MNYDICLAYTTYAAIGVMLEPMSTPLFALGGLVIARAMLN
jgi:hypothetical protein